MDCTNPFSEDFRDEEEAEPGAEDSEQEDIQQASADALEPGLKVDASSIADYLLRKKFVLTALELHMELLESGKELSRLRDFFSNPANFEQQANGSFDTPNNTLHRTGSVSTFDSLDLAHYSDDGAPQDDRVAVLEFELRKANETIKSLRMSLTGTLEEDSFLKADLSRQNDKHRVQESTQREGRDETEINPLMKRALNYLVNEYLLQNDYKLASITLADEIEDQDFEDWDDVGLNMPKPPNLMKLFQAYSFHKILGQSVCHVGIGTDETFADLEENFLSASTECEKLRKENLELSEMVTQLREKALNRRESSTPVKEKHLNEELPHNEFDDISANTENHTDLVFEPETPAEDTSCDAFVGGKPPPERMSSRFWDRLFLSWKDGSCCNEWLSKEIAKIAAEPDELVSTLSSSLPKLLPTIDPEEREKVIPLLLSSAAMQRDSDVRNKLLHNLFNLIEKPERQQRQTILSGCVAYSRLVGAMQTEEDLLPQFWEQIGHKYMERRHLVAEACGVIAPFLRPEMQSSLLLSILRQMEQEEGAEKVREAIARSLAVLFSLLQDSDKYLQAFHIVCNLMKDRCSSVQKITKKFLLPAFACWSRQSGRLCDHLCDHFLGDIESCVANNGDQHSFEAFDFVDRLENFHLLMPSLFTDILLNIPSKHSDASARSHAPIVQFNDDSHQLSMLIEKEEDFLLLYDKFCAFLASVSLRDCKPLSSWLYDFIPRLLQIVRKIHPDQRECVNALCIFFSSLVTLFGPDFTQTHLKKQRTELFRMEGEEDVSRQISFENTPFTSAAVAVYACGILAPCAFQNQEGELSTFLNDTLESLATCHAPLKSLEVAMIEIRMRGASFHEILLDVLWNGIAHPSVHVRAATATLFRVMAAPEVGVKTLETRVLPALLTLSKDKEEIVQTSTLPAFGDLIECNHSGEDIIDRVVAQFSAFMAPTEGSTPHHSMNVEMVKTMGDVTPKADPKFCNEFVLPHLAAIAARNNQQSNKTKRSDIALEMLTAFTNISFCYISDSLLQSAFIPGLRCLLQDMEKLHPEHVLKVEKLIKEMEVKLEQRAPALDSESAISPAAADKAKLAKPRFYNKLF